MLTARDISAITAPEVVFEIAKSLDPLAFDNNDMYDRERRRVLVYSRVEAAYKEFHRRDRGLGWIRPEIMNAEIDW